MRIIILLLCLSWLSACGSSSVEEGNLSASSEVYNTEEEAINKSPSGEACLISGEYKEVTECVPTNRGKNGNCEDRTIIIDTRIWEIAYLRGDVDYNGTVGDRNDAQLATKNLFIKQLDNQPCPAAADITAFEGVEGRGEYQPDGFFTSNDINLWREVRQTGTLPLAEEDRFICASQCQVINHMAPEYK